MTETSPMIEDEAPAGWAEDIAPIQEAAAAIGSGQVGADQIVMDGENVTLWGAGGGGSESQAGGPDFSGNPNSGIQSAGESIATPQLARKLRQEMAAVRLMRGKWGITKKLDSAQLTQAAESFHADKKYIGASKKLINTKAEKYRDCCATINEAVAYWRSVTIPFPEDGTRLIRRDRLAQFTETLAGLRSKLRAQASELDVAYEAMIEEAKERLGDLHNPEDYPMEIGHLFRIDWDFPPTEPPNYLMQLSPKLYEEQVARVQARFEEAVRLTEEAFAEQFQKLVAHLADRLAVGEDGKPKIFKDSAIEGLQEFFGQFKALNIGGSAELEQLIEQAQQVVGAADPKALRKDVMKRQDLQAAMQGIAGQLDAMMVSRPTRKMDLFGEE